MKIHFEDHGQDFLAWQLDNNGIVVDVEPFQAWLWCGIRVRRPRSLKVGGFVAYRRPEQSGRIRIIRYPIRAIELDLSPVEFNA